MVENPYRAPAAPLLETAAARARDFSAYPDASVGARFLNYVVDIICIQLLGVVAGVVLILTAPDIDIENPGISYGFGFAILLLYYIVLELVFGRTVGKVLTGTRVVARGGGAPGFAAVLGRTFARLVPFEPFSCLDGNGWHDQWSDTRVVKVRGQRPAETE